MARSTPDDYDSPWKEALELYFEAFLFLFFRHIHAEIDWSRGYESLDKEFQQVVREAEHGRRYVDKLFRVWRMSGEEAWVLIHVEVQGRKESDFPRRMYVYNYRAFDRYNVTVVSLAVLADDDPDWRPTEFHNSLWGCTAGLVFPHVKLLDFAPRWQELEASDNPFAKVVLAHLKALETHGAPQDRYQWKFRIVRNLCERGFGAKDVRELFRLIDWMMTLPAILRTQFRQELDQHQQEIKGMPYITSFESDAMAKGLREGIESCMEIRFGADALRHLQELKDVYDVPTLQAVLRATKTVAKPEDLRPLWANKIESS